jgi:hypothetical protein
MWGRRVAWLVAIWLASVLALGVAALAMRGLMKLAGYAGDSGGDSRGSRREDDLDEGRGADLRHAQENRARVSPAWASGSEAVGSKSKPCKERCVSDEPSCQERARRGAQS